MLEHEEQARSGGQKAQFGAQLKRPDPMQGTKAEAAVGNPSDGTTEERETKRNRMAKLTWPCQQARLEVLAMVVSPKPIPFQMFDAPRIGDVGGKQLTLEISGRQTLRRPQRRR